MKGETTNRKRASEYQSQRARRKMGTQRSIGRRNIGKIRETKEKSEIQGRKLGIPMISFIRGVCGMISVLPPFCYSFL